MTIDSQIRDRLRAAVDDTTAPPAFAVSVLQRGRARRRRRYAAAGIAAVVAATAGAVLLPQAAPVAREGKAASTGRDEAALAWARSLPAGPAAKLPYFGEGGVRDGDTVVPIPDDVNRWYVPRAVDGGWVVVLGTRNGGIDPAVLSADGNLRPLPAYNDDHYGTSVVVSPDGSQVAYGDLVVDVASGEATRLPDDATRPVAWSQEGLVFQSDGVKGSPRLLLPNGTSVTMSMPAGASFDDSGPADLLVGYVHEAADTCTTTWSMVDRMWVERPAHCMGRALGELVDASPDGRWLLTDDLPEVWDLQAGVFATIDVPSAVAEQGSWLGLGGWESDDTFVMPFFDQWVHDELVPEGGFEQRMQIVRCTMSTGECERAGEEQVSRSEEQSRYLFSPVVRFGSAGR